MSRIRLAVAGFGKAGRRHVDAARQSDKVDLIGVADRSPEVRAGYGGAAPMVDSLPALLDLKPDAVIVALPHAQLKEATEEACAAGCHVLLEKPVATTVADARAVAAAAREAGVRLMVNFNHRFRREYQKAKELLEEGVIGTPTLFSEHMFAAAGPLPGWVWQADQAGGGMMMYGGVHAVDHLVWLADARISQVGAVMGTFHFPNPDGLEDTLAATLRFASGAVGTVVQQKSDNSTTLPHWDTLVVGTDGAVRVRTGVGLRWNSPQGAGSLETGEGDRFLATLDAFCEALLEDRPVPVGIEDGIHVLDTVLTLYRAAREGRQLAVESATTSPT